MSDRQGVGGRLFAVLVALALSAPAAAQFSDSFNFLKAVRDRDGAKATELLGKSGPTLIDTQDATSGERALHIATKRRDLQWMGFLIGKGARVDAKDRQGNTALLIASQLGFSDGVRLLLARGAQVDGSNSSGETPLILAVQRRDMETARLLLAQGANPKKPDSVAGMSARDYAERDNRAVAILKLIDETKPRVQRPVAGPR